VRWVKVVEVEAAAVVAQAGAVDVGQGEWVAQQPQGRAATASVPVVDTAKRTWWACLATAKSAPNAARK
jgi:hypothetical protein